MINLSPYEKIFITTTTGADVDYSFTPSPDRTSSGLYGKITGASTVIVDADVTNLQGLRWPIEGITIINVDGALATEVTVGKKIQGVDYVLFTATIGVNEKIVYNHGDWKVFDTTGGVKTSTSAGGTTLRWGYEESSATPTINTDNYDCFSITTLAVDITNMSTNLSGTPTNFQRLLIRIRDNGAPRAITWGTLFEAKGVALPTTTVASKTLTVGFIYDTVAAKWGCIASVQEI